MMGDCKDCDKECKDHGTMELLVQQHDERITSTEEIINEMGKDIAKMEGRLNSFIWILGLVFAAIIGIALYGGVQVGTFKDVYTKDTIAFNKTLSNIQSDMKHIKSDVERLSK